MTPRMKAVELVKKFRNEFNWVEKDHSIDLYRDTKQCALTACDDIIEGIERAFDEYEKATGVYVKNRIFYWDFYSDVKGEIRKL